MEISEVRVRLVKDTNDRLKAVCSVTLDGEFVVRDVKVVEGTNGLFVAMPSRKLSSPCPKCRTQNHLRSKHCNECGTRLPVARVPSTDDGREKAHRDIAHPITAAFRQTLQGSVLEAFREALEMEGEEYTDDSQSDEDERMVDEADDDSDYNTLIATLKGGREEVRGGKEDVDDLDRDGRERRRGGRRPRRQRAGDSERSAGPAAVRMRDEAPKEEPGVVGSRDSDTFGVFVDVGGRDDEDKEDKDGGEAADEKKALVSSITRDDFSRQEDADAGESSEKRTQPEDADDNNLGFGEGIL